MLRVLLSKYRHSAGRLIILITALVLGMLFFNMSAQLYLQSLQSVQVIEEKTTTLAIMQVEDEELRYDPVKGTVEMVSKTKDYQTLAAQSDAVIGVHPGTTLASRAEGIVPVLPSQEIQYEKYGKLTVQYTEYAAAMHIRCDKIEESYTEQKAEVLDSNAPFIWDENGQATHVHHLKSNYLYTVHATLMKTPDLRADIFAPSSKLMITTSMVNADGTPIFEEGKEYVVFGMYDDPLPRRVKGNYLPPTDSGTGRTYSFGASVSVAYEDGKATADDCVYVPNDDGSWSQHIVMPEVFPIVVEADDPRAQELYKRAKLNRELLYTTGISTINALPLFAMGDAYLTEGRDINKTDVTEQNPVCLISTAFAEHNGLAIGDKLPLEMYQAHMMTVSQDNGSFYYRQDFYRGEMQCVMQQEYTIVGIYSAPEWVPNKYCFSLNTILVPESTLTAEGVTGLLYAHSLILKNGTNQQFMDDVYAAGIPDDIFSVYDGGYMEFVKSLTAMQQDTRLLLIVCLLMYIVLVFSSLGMIGQHLRTDAVTMMKIGAARIYTTSYMLGCVLPIIFLSALIAYGVSCIAYRPVITTLENWYMLRRPAFSTLIEGSAGMLTGTVSAYPSPWSAGATFLIAAVTALVQTCMRRERSRR